MRRILFICSIIFFAISGKGQPVFKAVASQSTVVLGESFQVQYIFEDADKAENFTPPDLSKFRIIAGPDVYTGSMNVHGQGRVVKNWVYTLSCLQPGNYKISGAYVTINNKAVRGNSISIEIISLEEAARRYQKDLANDNSEYYLRPGEDPYEKIQKNLFLKVWVDHPTCYVGEPVMATFKLYSRLESKSDIVKNPGFYGFTVYDMVNLADKQMTTENISGKLFDVHTIRKVQLYPLQDGVYTIDEMDIRNKVEFSRSSAVNKRTEQEIVEGVLGTDDDDTKAANTEVFETEMHSEPLVIHVKPVPTKNKPVSFSGAVGNFGIAARMNKTTLARNEEGILEVLVSGKGNFIQLNAPIINWPDGMEGFEPTMRDSMDKNKLPLAGMRVYRFPFVCTKAGVYTIPPINLSYFNPDSGNYQITNTTPFQVEISRELKERPVIEKINNKPGKPKSKFIWVALSAVLLAILAGFVSYRRMLIKKAEKERMAAAALKNSFSLDRLMEPSKQLLESTDTAFYRGLQQSIWEFFQHYLGGSGTESRKDIIVQKLRIKKVDEGLITAIYNILLQCENGMFGGSRQAEGKTRLWENTREVLEKIQPGLL